MQKILGGVIVMLLFCVFTGVAYLRIPPKAHPEASHPLGPRAIERGFAGQRHTGIDVTAETGGDVVSPAIAQAGPIRADPGSR